jgi:hypothetical protein
MSLIRKGPLAGRPYFFRKMFENGVVLLEEDRVSADLKHKKSVSVYNRLENEFEKKIRIRSKEMRNLDVDEKMAHFKTDDYMRFCRTMRSDFAKKEKQKMVSEGFRVRLENINSHIDSMNDAIQTISPHTSNLSDDEMDSMFQAFNQTVELDASTKESSVSNEQIFKDTLDKAVQGNEISKKKEEDQEFINMLSKMLLEQSAVKDIEEDDDDDEILVSHVNEVKSKAKSKWKDNTKNKKYKKFNENNYKVLL